MNEISRDHDCIPTYEYLIITDNNIIMMKILSTIKTTTLYLGL